MPGNSSSTSVFFKWQDDDGAAYYTAYPILPVKK
jgi:hypothetical protein